MAKSANGKFYTFELSTKAPLDICGLSATLCLNANGPLNGPQPQEEGKHKMKSETVEVKLEKKPVGTATFSVYESLEEINSAITPEDLVVLVNRQVKLQAINKVRSIAANDTPSRKISRVTKAMRNGEMTKDQAAEKIQAILLS